MTKFAEFILTTLKGRLVLFCILATTIFVYGSVAKAADRSRCLIIGDSIAVGTKMFAPKDCLSYSKGGFNTWQWNKRWGSTPLVADTVVISLGTNDHKYVKTAYELNKVRHRIKASKVVWIMPPCNPKFCKSNINAIVQQIATEHMDTVIKTNHVQPDGIHPSWKGYKELVSKSGI